MSRCYDFFFDSRVNYEAFLGFFERFNSDNLVLDVFECENPDTFKGITIDTPTGMIPGDDNCYDLPLSDDEHFALDSFLEAVAVKFPGIRYI